MVNTKTAPGKVPNGTFKKDHEGKPQKGKFKGMRQIMKIAAGLIGVNAGRGSGMSDKGKPSKGPTGTKKLSGSGFKF